MIRADSLQLCPNADAAPSAPGAYILQIDLAEAVLVSTARQPPIGLLPGRYFYCGSANGPGGLRSRLARHMRHGKSLHWHIDQLTERGAVTGTWIVRNGRECDLVAMLAPLPMPIPGFGSSDCSRCLSHLLYLPSTIHRRCRLPRLLTHLLIRQRLKLTAVLKASIGSMPANCRGLQFPQG
jgi:Uri superfamily endonuclease